MTDPIAAMLIMLKNASRAKHEAIVVPHSKMKEAIAKCLEKNGFLKAVEKKTRDGRSVLELALAYEDGAAKVNDVKRVSKPSRRLYYGVKDLRPVKSGLGLLVLSTPKGILADKEAKKEQVGGEVLFSIW